MTAVCIPRVARPGSLQDVRDLIERTPGDEKYDPRPAPPSKRSASRMKVTTGYRSVEEHDRVCGLTVEAMRIGIESRLRAWRVGRASTVEEGPVLRLGRSAWPGTRRASAADTEEEMETLARWAGYLAIAGGALVVLLAALVTYDPNSPAWFAFFLVVALLGAAVLGLHERTKASTGQLGRWSAWLSAIGALALLIVFAYAAATGGISTDPSYDPTKDPLTPFWIVTAVGWFLGNLGFAAALIRSKVLSPIGAWLVLAGALVGLAVTVVLGENLPPGILLLFGLFGIGWIVVGNEARKPAPKPA